MFNRRLHGRGLLVVGMMVIGSMGSVASARAGLTTKSPEVRAAVQRGVAYLSSAEAKEHRPGGQALIGLALLKADQGSTHPMVQEAAEEIRSRVGAASSPEEIDLGNAEIYSYGLAVIFLCSLDPDEYSVEINALLKYLQSKQKSHGGWGYLGRDTGDTSMTQYGVLSAWEATMAGHPVPVSSIDNVTEWLMRTQDPTGGFGYQGTVAPGGQRVRQNSIRPSMVVAGLGSAYVCADLLGFARGVQEEETVSSELKEIKTASTEKTTARGKVQTRISAAALRQTHELGNQWMAANFTADIGQWNYYYLYSMERYYSFRELSEGRVDKEPVWYDAGARLLLELQEEDGSWKTRGGGSAVDSSFAILFLVRSTQKSIEKRHGLGPGTLVGGRGLPKDTSTVQLRDGQVVTTPELTALDKMFSSLEGSKEFDYAAAAEALGDLPEDKAAKMLAKHADRLRQLAGDSSPEARAAAVRALGRSRDLENVPTLVFALGDDDRDVVLEARNALRRLSRKFNGFNMPADPTDAQRSLGIENWKRWYWSIRPNAEFPEVTP